VNERLNFILALVLMLGGLLLVNSQYQTRQLRIELEYAVRQVRQLNIEWIQLQLNQSILRRKSRVEENAENDLNMTLPIITRTQYLIVGRR